MNLHYKLQEGQGIGNQLYSIFSLAYLASLTRRRPIILGYDKYKGQNFLPISSRHFDLISSGSFVGDKSIVRDDPHFNPISGLDVSTHVDFLYQLLTQQHCHVELVGNLQNVSFIPSESDLLELFCNSVVDQMAKICLYDDFTCTLHVRGGDYKKTLANMPQRYYYQALDCLKEIIGSDPLVNIVSDDLEYASAIAVDLGQIRSSPRTSADCVTAAHHCGTGIDRDFFSLVSSKYAVIPPSTFSFSARILAHIFHPDAITIAPFGWYGYRLGSLYAAPYNWAYSNFLFIDRSGHMRAQADCLSPQKPLFLLRKDIPPILRTLSNRLINYFIK